MLFFMPCVAWDHRSFTASLAPSKVLLPVCSVEAMLPAPLPPASLSAAGDAPVLCAAAEVGLVEEGDALSAASDPGSLLAGPAQRYNRLEGNEVPGQRNECKNGCPTQLVTGATPSSRAQKEHQRQDVALPLLVPVPLRASVHTHPHPHHATQTLPPHAPAAMPSSTSAGVDTLRP